jgi:DNA-binding MarR family transcriptional regulator
MAASLTPAQRRRVDTLVGAVRRTNIVLEASSLAARQKLGLVRADMVTLELLTLGPLAPTEIAEQLGINTSTATGILDRLEGLGLIQRTPSRTDRRRLMVSITPHGRRRFRSAYRTRWEWLHQMAASLDDADLQCVVRFLDRMHEIMPAHWGGEASA